MLYIHIIDYLIFYLLETKLYCIFGRSWRLRCNFVSC